MVNDIYLPPDDGVSVGASSQVPYSNIAGDDFLYSSNFTYDGTDLTLIGGIQANDYISSDGTSGATATFSGLTFKNGLYTAGTVSSVSFGTTTQIPYMNGTDDDFLYSADFTFDGSYLNVDAVDFTGLLNVNRVDGQLFFGGTSSSADALVVSVMDSLPTYTAGSNSPAGKDAIYMYSQAGANNNSAGELFLSAGSGGQFTLGSGSGGSVTGTPTFLAGAGSGGRFTFRSGSGGSVLSAGGSFGSAGGAGGDIQNLAGNGGYSQYSNPGGPNSGGAGGRMSFTAGDGGSASNGGTTNTGGAGGVITFTSGKPGTGATANGADGEIIFTNKNAAGLSTSIKFIDAEIHVENDNKSIFLGAADDASILYDGTNLVIDPQVVGAGILDVLGVVQTDGYNSSDGTSGASSVTGGLTFKNGLYTAGTVSSVSFGTTTQIPYMNGTDDDFLYSANLIFDGDTLTAKQYLAVDGSADFAFRSNRVRTVRSNDNAEFVGLVELTWTGAASTSIDSMAFGLIDSRTVNSGSTDFVIGMDATLNRTSSFLTSATDNLMEGLEFNTQDFGVYTSSAFSQRITYKGAFIKVDSKPDINYTGIIGCNHTISGLELEIGNDADTTGSTAGKYSCTLYGTNIVETRSTLNSDTTFYAYHNDISRSGYSASWCFYNNSAFDNFLGEDDSKTYFGTAQDASLSYNGTNLVIDPQEVGSGGVLVNNLTASKPVWTDASKVLVSKDLTACDIVRGYLTPTTQTVTTGTLTSGTVTDVQTWMDGNEVHITEVSGTPGFDIEYTITGVANFCEILVSFYYDGSGTHDCEISIYDDTNAVWREIFNQAGAGLNHNTRFTAFPDIANVANYINASDEVKLRFYHPVNGNASHDLYIDYVSIVGTST